MQRYRFLLAALLTCGATVLHAALPTFWQVSTEAELLRGDVENLAIDSFGRLTLGPTTATVYDASAPFLWNVISAPDGSLYAGSGNEGAYRIRPAAAVARLADRLAGVAHEYV